MDSGIFFIEDTYERWCTVINPNHKKTVIIPYVSAYGYTKQIAEKIEEGIKASGDIDVRSYDMVTADQAQVLEEIGFADGILFGTPTIVGEALKPIWDLTTSIFAGTHGGKLASAFGSYGWSGEGVPHIMERLKQLRMNTVDGLRIRFRPGDTPEHHGKQAVSGAVFRRGDNRLRRLHRRIQPPDRVFHRLHCGDGDCGDCIILSEYD